MLNARHASCGRAFVDVLNELVDLVLTSLGLALDLVMLNTMI